MWEVPCVSSGWEATLVAWCHNLIALDPCQHCCWQYIVNLVENGQSQVQPCCYFIQVAGAGTVGPLSSFLGEFGSGFGYCHLVPGRCLEFIGLHQLLVIEWVFPVVCDLSSIVLLVP